MGVGGAETVPTTNHLREDFRVLARHCHAAGGRPYAAPARSRVLLVINRATNKKGAQPLRRVGRQKRVFARAGRESGTSKPYLRLDGGALPMKAVWSTTVCYVCRAPADFNACRSENLTICKRGFTLKRNPLNARTFYRPKGELEKSFVLKRLDATLRPRTRLLTVTRVERPWASVMSHSRNWSLAPASK